MIDHDFALLPLRHPTYGRLLSASTVLKAQPHEVIDALLDKLDQELKEEQEAADAAHDYDAAVEEAVRRAQEIPSGQEFTLARLFPTTIEWNALPPATELGKRFKRELVAQEIADPAGRDHQQKMAKYRRR